MGYSKILSHPFLSANRYYRIFSGNSIRCIKIMGWELTIDVFFLTSKSENEANSGQGGFDRCVHGR
jgi:hypothetical protein